MCRKPKNPAQIPIPRKPAIESRIIFVRNGYLFYFANLRLIHSRAIVVDRNVLPFRPYDYAWILRESIERLVGVTGILHVLVILPRDCRFPWQDLLKGGRLHHPN